MGKFKVYKEQEPIQQKASESFLLLIQRLILALLRENGII